jgi:hypothetical protein
LKKIVEFERKLNRENVAMTHFEFGLFYERKENFLLAIYYYKQNFECLLKNNAHQIDLMRTYSFIGKMYEKLNFYSILHLIIQLS